MAIINPFKVGGFDLAHMTKAINQIPNRYGKINDLGIFNNEPVTQRSVLVEKSEGILNLLPTRPLGAPATVGAPDERSLRSFTIPHIPHNDVVLPEDVMGIRGFGLESEEDALATVLGRKLAKMRMRHAQTLEYMRAMALAGITKDGSGNTIYNWFDEFGFTQKVVNFALTTDSTDVAGKCREVKRYIEDNLLGESMSEVLVLCSPEFFDALVGHSKVKDAYLYYNAGVRNPLAEDVRSGFRFGGITFVEYAGSVSLATGTAARLIEENTAIAFPLGTMDTFVTYFAPANYIEAVGTYGVEIYAKQIERLDGTGIDIYTQSNPLPLVKRPNLLVKLTKTNS